MERLDKFLCDCGVGTRSEVKAILKSGRVTVDGKPVKDNGLKIHPESQTVCLDGERVSSVGRVVLMLHKPAGYVTATKDAKEPTVMELLPQSYQKLELNPVGRLDKQTEGLLLFTNDGNLLHKLISPKKGVEKEYYACHEGTATQADIDAFAQGLTLKDGTVCLPAVLQPVGEGQSRVTVCEGRYHQVRRMLASRGMPVTYLRREREGNLTLGALEKGQIRLLSEAEVKDLEDFTKEF